MKYQILRLGFTLLMVPLFAVGFSQTVTELVVPKYFGSKTAASTNNARTAFAVCLKIDGLTPNTVYDIKPAVGLVTEAPTVYGAGNSWNGTAFTGTTNLMAYFTTDASGSSGTFWVFIQPTGNASRFDAGQQHNVRLGWVVTGGTMPSSPLFVGTKILTALDIAVTARTPATTDDGCFLKGSCLAPSNGKYMLMFDNVAGTGDPLFAYMIRPALPTQSANSELPTAINDIYMQAGGSAAGDYPAVIPIGANNANGVRRVESRNPDNTVFAFNTSANGVWPSGANTTTALRRDLVVLTNTDTPLTPAGPSMPTVTTDPTITNISFNYATGGGNVTNTGGSSITARGLCWSLSTNPVVTGLHTTEPGSLGPFISNMTGLLPNSTYHVRAYATNTAGTAYGADVTFSTLCEVMAPLPDFAASKVNLTVGETINFFDSTKFCPDAWNWSFNGATPNTSTVQNPTGITYNYSGDYTVCLTATNQWGQQTTCKTAYIHVIGPTNAKIVMTEIMYNPPELGTDTLEFIEVLNNDNITWNLMNFYFDQGITFVFPNISLAPGAYLLVSKSSAAMQNSFGVPSQQWTESSLNNNGEPIVIKDNHGFLVDSVYYGSAPPWDTLANGQGPSLELCDPDSDNTNPANWRHALEFQLVNAAGDSIWASPLAGCSYPPVSGFSASDTTLVEHEFVTFTDASSYNTTNWEWTFEGGTPGTYSGQTPPNIQYNNMGVYDVTLRASNIAGHHTLVKTDYIEVGTTGIADRDATGFTIYPNPNNGTFKVILKTSNPVQIRIVNTLSNIILERTSNISVNLFDHLKLTPGIYLIKVADLVTKHSFTKKLIIHQ